MEKSADAFRTISEVSDELRLPQHVLRFWETRFPQIRPLKRAGGRRYYRPTDMVLLRSIRHLLYEEGYTIKGVQRLMNEQGAKRLSGEGLFARQEPTPLDPPGVLKNDDDIGPISPVDMRVPFASDKRNPRGPTPFGSVFAEPDLLATGAFAPHVHGSLRETLAIIEECLGILDALR